MCVWFVVLLGLRSLYRYYYLLQYKLMVRMISFHSRSQKIVNPLSLLSIVFDSTTLTLEMQFKTKDLDCISKLFIYTKGIYIYMRTEIEMRPAVAFSTLKIVCP